MSDSEKLVELEEKISWLEAELEKQSNEVTSVYETLDKLKVQFKILYSKVGDPYATRDLKDEVPPPHYQSNIL